jgi:GTP-binding protein
MTFMVNDSPLAGREGDKVTTRMIRARLMREGEGKRRHPRHRHRERRLLRGRRSRRLAARRADRDDAPRGLRAGRRAVRASVPDRPKTGQRLEPIEEVVIDVDDAYTGPVVEQISLRKGELQDMRPSGRRQDPPGVLRPRRAG